MLNEAAGSSSLRARRSLSPWDTVSVRTGGPSALWTCCPQLLVGDLGWAQGRLCSGRGGAVGGGCWELTAAPSPSALGWWALLAEALGVMPLLLPERGAAGLQPVMA